MRWGLGETQQRSFAASVFQAADLSADSKQMLLLW